MKKWKIAAASEGEVLDICKKTGLPPICAEILAARGMTDIGALADFFNADTLEDPFALADMQKGADVINETIDKGGKICVYGDYDCDGVTATVLLYSYLECMGADVFYYIPEREEGYGLNVGAIDKISEKGAELIVTVDNGISAINEAEYIYGKGMKLVVTDHHRPQAELPRADAVINPHREDCPSAFKDTAGVGVALKLCAALDDGNYDMVLEQYADLAAIGTVADVVPLLGENRIIVKKGLLYLKNTENAGLNELIDRCSLKRENIDSTSVAFVIAPRINAAGRFGSPKDAVRTLLCEQEDEAASKVETLCVLNSKRKAQEQEILDEILAYLSENPSELMQRVLVVAGEGWHHGVIGIVAARLLEMFGKPCVVLSGDGGMYRGSVRSVKGFHIHKCLCYCDDLLVKYGGHECAGGLSLERENLELFRERVFEYAKKTCPIMPTLTLEADKVLRGRDLTVEAVKSLSIFEPFGEGNKRPLFAVIGARLMRIFSLSEGKHTKLELSYDGATFQALMFFVKPTDLPYKVGDVLDMLVTLELSIFGGRTSVAVKAVDTRLHGVKQNPYFAAKASYESFMTGEELPPSYLIKMIPMREEIVSVYKYLAAAGEITLEEMFMRLSDKFNYGKLRFTADILSEAGLVNFDALNCRLSLVKVDKKHNLNDSQLFVRLNGILDGLAKTQSNT